MNIEDLPPEVLTYLFTYLPGKDLASLARVSRTCKDISNIDRTWQKLCIRDYNIGVINTSYDITFQELYKKVLYKYGHTIGVWQAEIGHYGGLIQVKWTGQSLLCIQHQPPINPHVDAPLRAKPLFSIKLNYAKEVEILCLQGFFGPHPLVVSQTEANTFTSKCLERAKHQHPLGKQAEYQAWLINETEERVQNILLHGHELLLMKFLITSHYDNSFTFTRLHLPEAQNDVIIQPGLFKGNYGSHGVEIIRFDYVDNKTKFEGIKITGDPNVPASQKTIVVDMERPMILTLEQQDSINTLSQIDTPHLADVQLAKLPQQSFLVPSDCSDRYHMPNRPSPKFCKARFHTKAQVAGHDFTSPTFIPGHFIVFDDNTIGHIWLELHSFSVYCRVTEDFNDVDLDQGGAAPLSPLEQCIN